MKRKGIIEDKRGGFTDLFIFIIFTFVIGLIVVVFLFISNQTNTQLHESMDDMDIGDAQGNNASVVIDNTMGVIYSSYLTLKWTSILMIVGMILGIFIGSYMVRTKPVFLIPYIFLVIIAIIVSVGMANAYDTLMSDPTLASTFNITAGMNWFILYLPIVVTIIGFVGGLIMFSQVGKGGEQFSYYGY